MAEPAAGAPQFEPWELERTDGTVGVVATVGAGGYPHAAPVFLRWQNGGLRFESEPTSAKARNLKRDPRVSVIFQGKPKWGVLVTGKAQVLSENPGEQTQFLVVPERKSSWKRKEA